jgi:flagellar transcriptional activator FlhD
MNADQILMEIRETNLSYLMLAQSLIRADREQALFRLGMSEVDDDLVWTLLTSHGKGTNDSVTRLHANILMAGRHQEAA